MIKISAFVVLVRHIVFIFSLFFAAQVTLALWEIPDLFVWANGRRFIFWFVIIMMAINHIKSNIEVAMQNRPVLTLVLPTLAYCVTVTVWVSVRRVRRIVFIQCCVTCVRLLQIDREATTEYWHCRFNPLLTYYNYHRVLLSQLAFFVRNGQIYCET